MKKKLKHLLSLH